MFNRLHNVISEFLNNYYVPKPTLINFKMLPFGNRLPPTHQEWILNYKFNQENKYWLRYQYLLNHINPVLDYLKLKQEWALFNCRFDETGGPHWLPGFSP